MTDRRLRAYRLALDPNQNNEHAFARHAGAARWAYNHALAAKLAASRTWGLIVDEFVTMGYTTKEAQKQASGLVKTPVKGDIQKNWNRLKGDDKYDIPGICSWWRSVSTYAFQSAFENADDAWKNYMQSLAGTRAGKRVFWVCGSTIAVRAACLVTAKRLATRWSEVALQDLDVVAMVASPRGTVDNPGTGVRQKALLNRRVLDASFGEFRRQVEYKAQWYGATTQGESRRSAYRVSRGEVHIGES